MSMLIVRNTPITPKIGVVSDASHATANSTRLQKVLRGAATGSRTLNAIASRDEGSSSGSRFMVRRYQQIAFFDPRTHVLASPSSMRGLAFVACLAACGGDTRAVVEIHTPNAPPVLVESEHALALDKLLTGELSAIAPNDIEIPLPDAEHWDNVNFVLVPSVVSMQYGLEDDFHAILGGFIVKVHDNRTPGECTAKFETWASEWLDAFDVDYTKGKAWSWQWSRQGLADEPPVTIEGADVLGKVATLIARGTYECAFAAYPAWKDTCLIVALGVPSKGERTRAKALRDRFTREVFPNVHVSSSSPPPEVRH
jgi:hypothetical protein